MSERPLLDRIHLAAQTADDADLARELLGLFRDECRRILPGLVDPAVDAIVRADLAHGLRGAALGIGAFRVAERGADYERRLRAGEAASEAPLAEAVDDTLDLIERE